MTKRTFSAAAAPNEADSATPPWSALVARLAMLLHAPITIMDVQGTLLASSEPHLANQLQPMETATLAPAAQRIALTLDGQPLELMISPTSPGEVISPRLVRAFVELVATQLPRPDQPAAEKAYRKDRFIYTLLQGLATDEVAALSEAKFLGLNVAVPRAVMLVDASAYIHAPASLNASDNAEALAQQRAKSVINSIVACLHLPNDTICAHLANGEIAVLKASNTRNLKMWAEHATDAEPASPAWTNLHALKRAGAALLTRLQKDTGTSVSIGLGRYHPGLHGLARSYQDARAALVLGQRFQRASRVYCLDGLGIAAFVGVADERTKIELASHLLSPLNQTPELMETLSVFFSENCLPSATASRLTIHRNTLSYRLNKITALTGLDPRQFDCAVQMRLALLLLELKQRS